MTTIEICLVALGSFTLGVASATATIHKIIQQLGTRCSMCGCWTRCAGLVRRKKRTTKPICHPNHHIGGEIDTHGHYARDL